MVGLPEQDISLGEFVEEWWRVHVIPNLAPCWSRWPEDPAAWLEATTRPGGLVFPRPDGSPWTRDDWANWRHRVFQANTEKIGRLKARPYDLRHSFVSLLIAEGRTVIDVAGQAGHSPETCLCYYAHLFAECDPAVRLSAEEEIRKARRQAGGRSEDAGGGEAAAA